MASLAQFQSSCEVFNAIHPADAHQLMQTISQLPRPHSFPLIHSQIVTNAASTKSVLLRMILVPISTEWFETCFRSDEKEKVADLVATCRDAVMQEVENGAKVVGLGAFTSIALCKSSPFRFLFCHKHSYLSTNI
jgi:hypothetical protein